MGRRFVQFAQNEEEMFGDGSLDNASKITLSLFLLARSEAE